VAAGDDVVPAALYTSHAGPLAAWGDCVPGPGADCRFSVQFDLDAKGMDLSGIDLGGASVYDADFTGANLSGAQFTEATIRGVFADANLSNVSARASTISGDLTGATLDGANLASSILDASFGATSHVGANLVRVTIMFPDGASMEGADLAGFDLRNASFSGPFGGAPGNMRGVDFSGSKLGQAYFRHVDLTGAIFRNASMGDTRFANDVVCPNGKAPRANQAGTPTCGG
jgi:uncharacterized protein YjbI with pentapeptide repeats